MAKITFLISVMFLSCYLTKQAISSNDLTRTRSPGIVGDGDFMLLERKGVTKSSQYKIRDPKNVSKNQIHKEFDARKHWPKCKTIGEVHNDGNSDLSWAYASTGAFADRMCIETNGSFNQLLSTEELIACSGIRYNADADDQAWNFFKTNGLVTGGKYNSKKGCQPSKRPPIFNIPTYMYVPVCHNHCFGNNTIDYNHDHVKITHRYTVSSKNIQREVQAYGPVSALFHLYDDLYLYKSGVYTKSNNAKLVRSQFAKIIGWGVENGVAYWLLVHSWGREWGQNGLFKIKRGSNECLIETCVSGGVPDIK